MTVDTVRRTLRLTSLAPRDPVRVIRRGGASARRSAENARRFLFRSGRQGQPRP